jgi:hypothetical protein
MRQKNKLLWLLPVIFFLIIIIIRVFAFLTVYNSMTELETRYPAYRDLRRQYLIFQIFLWPGLILGQAIVYWLIRKKLYNKSWVFLHTALISFAFLLLPFLSYYFRLPQIRISNFSGWNLVFWFCVIAAHLFFILTLVKSFRKPEQINEPPGLLDEFVS